jgi:hypothetical protein
MPINKFNSENNLLSLVIKLFFYSISDFNSQHFYRLKAVSYITVTTVKTLIRTALKLFDRWKRYSKVIKKTCLHYLLIHQIVCQRHRIFPFFELLDELNATCYVYVYDDGKQAQSNYWITIHCRSLSMHDCLVIIFSVTASLVVDRPCRTGGII